MLAFDVTGWHAAFNPCGTNLHNLEPAYRLLALYVRLSTDLSAAGIHIAYRDPGLHQTVCQFTA